MSIFNNQRPTIGQEFESGGVSYKVAAIAWHTKTVIGLKSNLIQAREPNDIITVKEN